MALRLETSIWVQFDGFAYIHQLALEIGLGFPEELSQHLYASW